jgi:hypothetical protein
VHIRGVTAKLARSGLRCALAVALTATLASCGDAKAGRTPPLPPVPTTPGSVVAAYLAAAKSGDCTLTRALTQKSTWAWCDDPKLLDYRSVGAAVVVRATGGAAEEQCVAFEMDTHGSADGTIPIGWQPWSFCLVHTDGGWRVGDQGQA